MVTKSKGAAAAVAKSEKLVAVSTAKPKAYSYVRFSTPEQAKGDSLRRQTQLAEAYALTHGLELDTELNMRDLGVSAFRGANMEQGALGAFLTAAQTGVVEAGSYLLVESLDRVSRKTAARAANILQSICYAGVRVVTLNDGRIYDEAAIDTDGGISFIMAVLTFMRAHEESLTKSRRLSASWVNKRARAHETTVTARMPAWLKLDAQRKPVLDEGRAKVVRRIVKDYLKGSGVESIARMLNNDSVAPFGKADHWRRSSVYKILRSPPLIGTAVFSAADPADSDKMLVQRTLTNYYPAVISLEDYERVTERTGKSSGGGRQHKGVLLNLLSGLARCPVCDGTMTRISKGTGTRAGKPFLVCARAKVGKCDYIGVHLEVLEKLLLDRYAEILNDMPAADATVERELQEKQVAADALEERMDELLRVLERVPSDSLGKRVQELDVDLRARREELQALQDRANASEGKLVAVRVEAAQVAMRARPIDRSRINGCLRELLASVVVDYTTGYLKFRWRHRGESSVLYAMPSEKQ